MTSILEAHLSNVSYRLNEVMKVLTVITVIFMPVDPGRRHLRMNMHLPGVGGAEESADVLGSWILRHDRHCPASCRGSSVGGDGSENDE